MSGRDTAAVEQRAELAEGLTTDLDDGRHYAGLGYQEIDGERRLVEVVWNHEIDQGGVGYPRDDFTDREDSQEHRALAVEKVGEPDEPAEQTTLVPDGGSQTAGTYRCPGCQDVDVPLNGITCAECGTTVEALQNDATSRPPITREHLHGATIWAYGAGGAHVKPWVHSHQFSRFGGGSRGE